MCVVHQKEGGMEAFISYVFKNQFIIRRTKGVGWGGEGGGGGGE